MRPLDHARAIPRSITLSCLTLALVAPLSHSGTPAGVGAGQPPSELPPALSALVASSLAESGLDAVWQVGTPFADVDAAWQAAHRRGDLRSYFTPSGIRVVPFTHGGWQLGLELESMGRAGDLRRVPSARLAVDGPRAEYRRPGLLEWYVNRAAGPEHGFDIPSRPSGEGRLELALRLDTDLVFEIEPTLRSLRFSDAPGHPVLRLDGLLAYDADGLELDARFERRGALVVLSVDDRGARYPVTIDPVVQNEDAQLVPAGGPVDAAFGSAVALEGERVYVGAPGTSADILLGSVYVFEFDPQQGWQLEAKLTNGFDARVGDRFGAALAAQADMLVVGAPRGLTASTTGGYVAQFDHTGGVWARTDTIVGSDTLEGDDFGRSVALDDHDLLVGAPEKDDPLGDARGAVYAFSGSTSGWTQRNKLVGSPGLANHEFFGASVDVKLGWAAVGALGRVYTLRKLGSSWSIFGGPLAPPLVTSNFGSVVHKPGPYSILVPDAGTNAGIIHEYELNQVWQHVAEITPADGNGSDFFGRFIATHGDELLASSLSDHAGLPFSLYTFRDNGGSWSQLSKVGLAAGAMAVAMDAGRAVVGAPGSGLNPGDSAFVFARQGAGWSLDAELHGVQVDPDEDYGQQVALLGDLAAVSSPLDSDAGIWAGAVYLFERVGGVWQLDAKLTGGTLALPLDSFGRSVALDDSLGLTRLAVGAPSRRLVWVFERGAGGWSVLDRVGSSMPGFGQALALQGQELLIGETLYEFMGADYGISQTLSLAGTGASAVRAVALDGDVALLADFHWDGDHAQQGAAWVFDRSPGGAFNLRQRLESASPEPGARFGLSLALDGGRLAIGEPQGTRGRVSVFDRAPGGSWQPAGVLGSAAVPAQFLGTAVGIEGERVLAGATSKSFGGSIFVFREAASGWSEELQLIESSPAAGDGIGDVLAVSDGRVLTSAPRDDGNGVAYVFELPDPSPFVPYCFGDGSAAQCPCGNFGQEGEGCANSSGRGSELSASGSPSVSADDLVVHYASDLPGKPALLFSGNNALAGAFFNDGLRCAGGAVLRHGFRHPDGAGAAAWAGLAPRYAPLIGQSVFIQAWYRDPQGPCGSGSNLTNGLEVQLVP